MTWAGPPWQEGRRSVASGSGTFDALEELTHERSGGQPSHNFYAHSLEVVMDIALHWDGPYDLRKAPREGLIYALDELEDLDDAPGVYVFARVHGARTVPLYIGQAQNVRRRIRQQLNNVKLMRGLENAPNGYRTLHVAWPQLRPGQQQAKVLSLVESALISTALSQGFELLNVQGTKTLSHRIESSGNREAREWLPGREMLLRRGS